jgi:hypothetical protein
MTLFEVKRHAGLTIKLHYDTACINPRNRFNESVIVSFTRDFEGDEYLSVEDDFSYYCPICQGSGENQNRYNLLRFDSDEWHIIGAGSFECMEEEMIHAMSKAGYDSFGDGSVQLIPSDCPHCDNGINTNLEQYIRYEFEDAEIIIPLRFSACVSTLSETGSDTANAVIYMSRETLQKEWDGDRKKARKHMEAEVKEYSKWMAGEVYGYVIKDINGKETDSRRGFIGDIKYVRKEAERAAEGCAEALDTETT